ncbi:MAG: hypothetical protein GXX79_04310 [Actinomycetales bacterium]|nr:hypothetical protein [Actinomycetales bacterium]
MSPAARSRPPGVTLAEFRSGAAASRIENRTALVAAAEELLSGAYVHLRQKQARYGVDPVRQLRMLRTRAAGMTDEAFRRELTAVFSGLRDRHTGYLAPTPFAGTTAVLPFLVEAYRTGGGAWRHVVSKVSAWCPAAEGFVPGAEVTHWNGVPIQRAVERLAAAQRGATDDARTARGLAALVSRSLEHSAFPDEEWVTVSYRGPGGRRSATFNWRVIPTPPARPDGDRQDGDGQDGAAAADPGLVLAEDPGGQAVQAARRELYAPGAAPAGWLPTSRPAVLSARPLDRRTGYLRIWSFADADALAVRDEACRLVAALPPGGLVVDVRGNPGGHLPTAERLLQVLTRRPVIPAGFSPASTELTLAMSREESSELRRWKPSLAAAVGTGEAYAQALPLTPVAEANDLDEELRYRGPVVLVVDALTYSAADVFAAGFQDNGLGPVLGTGRTTGAGGANVWTADQVLQRAGEEHLRSGVPAGSGTFTLAFRRATRGGENAGLPLEDVGVTADEVHWPTRADLTAGNRDLLRAAVRLLRAGSGGPDR